MTDHSSQMELGVQLQGLFFFLVTSGLLHLISPFAVLREMSILNSDVDPMCEMLGVFC